MRADWGKKKICACLKNIFRIEITQTVNSIKNIVNKQKAAQGRETLGTYWLFFIKHLLCTISVHVTRLQHS